MKDEKPNALQNCVRIRNVTAKGEALKGVLQQIMFNHLIHVSALRPWTSCCYLFFISMQSYFIRIPSHFYGFIYYIYTVQYSRRVTIPRTAWMLFCCIRRNYINIYVIVKRILVHLDYICIENTENLDKELFKYTKIRQNGKFCIYAIREKVTKWHVAKTVLCF